MWPKNVLLTHPLESVVSGNNALILALFPPLFLVPLTFFFLLPFCAPPEHFDGKFEESYWNISSLASKLSSSWSVIRKGHTYMNKTASCFFLHTVNSDLCPLYFLLYSVCFYFFKKGWSWLRSFEHTDLALNWSLKNTDLVCCYSM